MVSYTWIVGTEPLVVPIAETTGWSVVTVEVAKGLLFVTLTAGLLWWSLRWYLQLAASSERRWEALATATQEGLFVIELGPARMLWANDAFEQATGRRLAEFQTDPTLPFQIVADDHAALLRQLWVAPAEVSWPVQLRIVRADGTDRFVEVSGTVTPHGRDRQVFQGLLVDVTEAREREQHLAATAEAERAATQHLEATAAAQQAAVDELTRVVAAKDGLLSAMSHELRTPLTVVAGWAQTLLHHHTTLSADQQRAAAVAISEQADRLIGLADDLLQLDQFEQYGPTARPVHCDAAQCVAAAVATSPAASRVRMDLVNELPVKVDRGQLRRIVQELLSNVDKYAPDGKAVVTVDADDSNWWLQVVDEGPGLPDHADRDVLAPFTRFDHDHHSPGAGLGLTLVSRYVEAHAGELTLQSCDDGLTVTITFPLELPAQQGALKAV